MTTPTPDDAPLFDPPVFCSGIERECKHGQLARSCNICELERELAAAQERINKSEADIAAMTTYAKTQQDRAQAAEARAEASAMDAERYRSALLELRIHMHAAGRRPEENYEMSVIDAAIAEGKK